MKRCQKCNRTFPDENQKFCTIDGGLLVTADQAFDPNATIQSSASKMGLPPPSPAKDETVDLNATIATPSTAETAVLPRKTGPTGAQTVPRQPSSAPLPPQPAQPKPSPPPTKPSPPATKPPPPTQPLRAQPPVRKPSAPLPPPPIAPAKKSKLPLILGILALLLVLGIGAVAAIFFLVIRPRLNPVPSDSPVVTTTDNGPGDANLNTNSDSNTNTANNTPTATEPEFTPPADAIRFENSQANLDGKLAEHYVDFSFYYPKSWAVDPKAGGPGATNFAKVERRLPPDFTQENFAVGWYESKGTVAADESSFPRLVELLNNSLKNLPEYRKVSEGPTKVNSLDGYEFRFVGLSKGTDKGDLQLWGRVIFLPPGVEGGTNGATLSMLTTSLAPELSGVEDVGEKGEMPVILESFRFGKRP